MIASLCNSIGCLSRRIATFVSNKNAIRYAISPDLAIQRVAQRVRNGGHDIPKEVVLRRYQAGIDNFFNIYMPCVDYWLLADNSETPRIIVAEGGRGMEMHIHHIERFNKIQSYVRE